MPHKKDLNKRAFSEKISTEKKPQKEPLVGNEVRKSESKTSKKGRKG